MEFFQNPLFTTIIGSILTGWFFYISSRHIETKKRELARNNFISIILEELPHDIKIFKEIENQFDPNYPARTWVNMELLESLLLNDSISNYRDNRCHFDDRKSSEKILTYVQKKRAFIYGVRSDLNQLSLMEQEDINRNHLVSNLSSRIKLIPEIISDAENIQKLLERQLFNADLKNKL